MASNTRPEMWEAEASLAIKLGRLRNGNIILAWAACDERQPKRDDFHIVVEPKQESYDVMLLASALLDGWYSNSAAGASEAFDDRREHMRRSKERMAQEAQQTF